MYCGKCGEYFDEKRAVFCPLCGERITVVTEDKIKTLELNKEKNESESEKRKQDGENISSEKEEDKSLQADGIPNAISKLFQQIFGKANKTVLRVLPLVGVAVLIICFFSYLNSPSYIEKKLTKDTWFSSTYLVYSDVRGMAVRFYSDGHWEMKEAGGYSEFTGEWGYYGGADGEWEIMDNKTLRINKTYYEWGRDWSFSGSSFHLDEKTEEIDGKTYYSDDRWDYCDDVVDFF